MSVALTDKASIFDGPFPQKHFPLAITQPLKEMKTQIDYILCHRDLQGAQRDLHLYSLASYL